MGAGVGLPSFGPDPLPHGRSRMAHPHDVRLRSGDDPSGDDHAAGTRRHLTRCWRRECDIDPLILRVRLLRRRGAKGLAICLEQELLPLF
jgi:hypothetical protein